MSSKKINICLRFSLPRHKIVQWYVTEIAFKICSSFVYITKMFLSLAYLNEIVYVSKSFCVSKFGKMAVTSTSE
jgi:hypothetical protein